MNQIDAEWIAGHEPRRDNEHPTFFKVGDDGVTAIRYSERNMGTYGVGFFQVWKGDVLFHEMNITAVADVRYLTPTTDL
jgi:hypothetical protein